MTPTCVVDAPADHHRVPPPARPEGIEALGGVRGMIDGGIPPLVFVVVHAIAGAQTTRAAALGTAAIAAGAAGLAVVTVRLVRQETLRQALAGLTGLAVAIAFAAWSGEARAYFLPGIYVDAAYAVAFVVSALVGRPLVGTIYGLLFRHRTSWRDDPVLRRVFTIATVGWSVVFGLRAGVQGALYDADLPGLLAAGKLLLGWPLTVLAVVLTLAAVRRATTGRAG